MLAWVVAVGAVLAGQVAARPNERTVYFGPRATVFLVLAALGLPILALRTWRSAVSWSARAAVAFLVVASVSAALSTAPLIGFFGANEVGTGWLSLVGLAALWALGTGVGTSGASLLGKGLLVLELLNAGVTLLEVGGQGWSLLGSFVWSWWVMVGGLGVETYLTGERYGLLFIAGLFIWVVVARRGKAAVAFAVAAGGGLLVGLAIQSLVRLGTSVPFRTVTSEGASGAFGPRMRIWTASPHAVEAHPVFGSGPGQSESATLPYRSVTTVLHDGVFPDTHNILVEIAVTTGLLGLALFVAWLVPAFRRARDALLLYSIALFAGGLLEPLDLTATGLAFLALGAAAVGAFERDLPPGSRSSQGVTDRPSTPRIAAQVVLVALALFAGLMVMIGNTQLNSGITNHDLATLASANSRLPMWNDAANALSDFLDVEAQRNAGYYRLALPWDQLAVSRDPLDATARRRLGFNQAAAGDLSAGYASLVLRSATRDPAIQLT